MTEQPQPAKVNPTFAKVREALKDALERGWTRVPSAPGIAAVRYGVELVTPESSKWAWPGETYEQSTFVSFVTHDGRVSAAIIAERANPFLGRRDQKVSVKRALELLASVGNDTEGGQR